MNTISTRTPEGERIQCPICRHTSVVVSSIYPAYDATCPSCGSLLWLPEKCSTSKAEYLQRMQEVMEWAARQSVEIPVETDLKTVAEKVVLSLNEVKNSDLIRQVENA